MGLFLFSVVLSVILAGLTWLIIGDRLPPGRKPPWDSRFNMLAYAGVILVVVYLTFFMLDF